MDVPTGIETWIMVAMFACTLFFPFFLGTALRWRDPKKLQMRRHFCSTMWLCLIMLVSVLFLLHVRDVVATVPLSATNPAITFVSWIIGVWLAYLAYGPGLIWLGYLLSPVTWFKRKDETKA
ncbi:MAG: hypothetical protein WC835_01185 [Candidatus Paceibacterota bacterium]|jgi:predicted Na+-dependent transporter